MSKSILDKIIVNKFELWNALLCSTELTPSVKALRDMLAEDMRSIRVVEIKLISPDDITK